MNARHLVVGASLVAGSIVGSATAPADAAATNCHSWGSGNTAYGYCEQVNNGSSLYEQETCKNKAGQYLVLSSVRTYLPWITVSVSCGAPFVRTSQRAVTT